MMLFYGGGEQVLVFKPYTLLRGWIQEGLEEVAFAFALAVLLSRKLYIPPGFGWSSSGTLLTSLSLSFFLKK